ncbi:SAG-related sequence protein SRS48K [Toxoplasma gondii VEG]|uniref:SAG-related sequence protein SRS48K n=1 Tax=Toxoplasma gondii (strain ATCC 50861 / VEG) TaxID=432359 RepID=V4YIR2_TOXGV|nr:SAG-related sequence protein SRS48K [Toxoplasma gondii VEG]
MVGRVSGAVCGVKALRSAVRAAVVIGLFCLSGGVMAEEDTSDVAMCSADKKNQTVVSVSLKNVNDSIQFACPENFVVFPAFQEPSEAAQFCKDSWCTAQARMGEAFTISHKKPAAQQKDTKKEQQLENLHVYTVTMKQQNLTSSTLYFQCRPEEERVEARVDTPGGKFDPNTTKCVIQVAAYGSKPAADEATEKECTLNTGLSATLHTSSTSFTFRCPKGSRLLPVNFDKAYEGLECKKKRSIARMGLGASLLEGKSATSVTTASPSSTEASTDSSSRAETVAAQAAVEVLPAYTFSVSEFPEKDVQVCYYCVDGSLKKEEINTRAEVCKALIEVKGVPKPDHAASSGIATFSTNMLVMAGAILISSALVMSISA